MMKTYIFWLLLLFMTSTLFIYGVISFITWDLNPANWSGTSRFWFILWEILSFISAFQISSKKV